MKTKISILLIAILMAAPKALAQEEVPSYCSDYGRLHHCRLGSHGS